MSKRKKKQVRSWRVRPTRPYSIIRAETPLSGEDIVYRNRTLEEYRLSLMVALATKMQAPDAADALRVWGCSGESVEGDRSGWKKLAASEGIAGMRCKAEDAGARIVIARDMGTYFGAVLDAPIEADIECRNADGCFTKAVILAHYILGQASPTDKENDSLEGRRAKMFVKLVQSMTEKQMFAAMAVATQMAPCVGVAGQYQPRWMWPENLVRLQIAMQEAIFYKKISDPEMMRLLDQNGLEFERFDRLEPTWEQMLSAHDEVFSLACFANEACSCASSEEQIRLLVEDGSWTLPFDSLEHRLKAILAGQYLVGVNPLMMKLIGTTFASEARQIMHSP